MTVGFALVVFLATWKVRRQIHNAKRKIYRFDGLHIGQSASRGRAIFFGSVPAAHRRIRMPQNHC